MFANARGFTFLEMLLVCAILSLLIGVALPRFSGTADSFAGREACRQLASAIRYAQQRSVLQRKLVRVVLDREKNCFTVVAPQGAGQQGHDNRVESLWSVPVELPSRVKFAALHCDEIEESATKWELPFRPDGRVPECTIELETSGERRYEVAIEARTGRVRTQRLAGEGAGLLSELGR